MSKKMTLDEAIYQLKDLQLDADLAPYQRGSKRGGQKTKETYKAKAADKNAELVNTFNACNMDGNVSVKDMAEYLGVSRDTVERRLKKCDELSLKNGVISRTESE